MKLIFLGDSLTRGIFGVDYVSLVAERLSQHTIVNAGSGGATVVNLLAKLDGVLAQEPDGVFIMIGGNDAISYSQPGARGYYRWTNGAPPDGRMTPDLFARSFRDLLTRLQLAHVLVWVALEPIEINPTVVAALRELNELARETAAALNIPVLDLMAVLTPEVIPDRPPVTVETINRVGERDRTGWNDLETERTAGGFTYSLDGIHLLPETAHRVADLIVDFLKV